MKRHLEIRASPLPFLFVLIILLDLLHGHSLPGKPKITKCLSRDKETFSCWWQPESDGGLPVNYTLYYQMEGKPIDYYCPDYTTSGPYSCYFDKKHTILWNMYAIVVNATNAMGTVSSDPKHLDVAFIVEPLPPVNVSLSIIYDPAHLLVKWLPPSAVDVKVGWVTLYYELEIKSEKDQEWETHNTGSQRQFKLFGLNPGENYIVRVRCRLDHGLWSLWSSDSYIQVPEDFPKKDMTLWISISVVSFVVCLTFVWTMALKRYSMVTCFLPPVPGPKIMGFDTQLLKTGRSEELLSALGCQGFPPTSDCEDLLVQYLEVDESKEYLITNNDKGQPNQTIKSPQVETDNDSGRGSCDSPSALFEQCKDTRVSPSTNETADIGGIVENAAKQINMSWPMESPVSDKTPSNLNDGKPYTWPQEGTLPTQNNSSSYHNITDVCKLALGAMNPNISSMLMASEDKKQPRYFKTIKTVSEENTGKAGEMDYMHSRAVDPDTMWLLPNMTPFMSPKVMDYVEVHKVHQNNALALIPKQKESHDRREPYPPTGPSREYTKVARVEDDNILVLIQDSGTPSTSMLQEPFKEYPQIPQQHQTENKLSNFMASVQSESRGQKGTLGYLDPTSFAPLFS